MRKVLLATTALVALNVSAGVSAIFQFQVQVLLKLKTQVLTPHIHLTVT